MYNFLFYKLEIKNCGNQKFFRAIRQPINLGSWSREQTYTLGITAKAINDKNLAIRQKSEKKFLYKLLSIFQYSRNRDLLRFARFPLPCERGIFGAKNHIGIFLGFHLSISKRHKLAYERNKYFDSIQTE